MYKVSGAPQHMYMCKRQKIKSEEGGKGATIKMGWVEGGVRYPYWVPDEVVPSVLLSLPTAVLPCSSVSTPLTTSSSVTLQFSQYSSHYQQQCYPAVQSVLLSLPTAVLPCSSVSTPLTTNSGVTLQFRQYASHCQQQCYSTGAIGFIGSFKNTVKSL